MEKKNPVCKRNQRTSKRDHVMRSKVDLGGRKYKRCEHCGTFQFEGQILELERKMKETVKAIFVFPNGNVAVTNQFGEQIVKLQPPMTNPTVEKILEKARILGFEISKDLEVNA